jgi:hypothetical protein
MHRLLSVNLLTLSVVVLANAHAVAEPTAQQLEFFESKIRPLLANHCYRCHSSELSDPKGNLRVDSLQGLLDGGDSGPSVVVGDPESSYLMEAIGYENTDVQMPPKGKLPDDEIALIRQWITDGAAWPAEQLTKQASAKQFDLAERKAEHWCWQPVKPQTAPQVSQPDWVLDRLDGFVLAKLEAAGLSPAPPADRNKWLRRVTFDLIGLPPTPEELAAFQADDSPAAFETVVDRLLGSPHFGERWGRHWLDLVRYAETFGHEFDYPVFQPWRYRDYVIRAINADVPYDQFLVEHIAGDLLAQPRLHPEEGTNESIVATGFWFLGEQVHAPVDVLQHQADVMDNQIDVMGKAFLGLTLGCARCHDHKFDAISTKDVYSLWGFMQSSRLDHATLDPHGRTSAIAQRLKDICQTGDEVLRRNPPSPDNSPSEPIIGSLPANTVSFESFNQPHFDGWFTAGLAFADAPTRPQQWDSFQRKASWVKPGIAHSGMLARQLHGTLRSKSFTIEHSHIWVRAAGRGGRVRLVVENYTMNEHNDLLFTGLILKPDSDEFVWHVIAGDLGRFRGHRAYLEIVDDGDGYIAVDEIVFNEGERPAEPSTTTPTDGPMNAESEASLQGLSAELDRAIGELPPQIQVLAIADGEGIDQHVYIRGSHKNRGEMAHRKFIEALDVPGHPAITDAGSGRFELARKIADPGNPLTARVVVNRIWHHLFGRGLVATTDNFGALGQPPSHPELLDDLALRFVTEGWSVKRVIRQIVLSQTYRQSSETVAAAAEKDPQNILLHRMPVKRLEAEVIRDAILATSGRLDRQLYGPSIPVHLTGFMLGRGMPASGPLDGAGRRSIYIEVRRNFLSPMMLAFDAPIPFATVGNRGVSNVPAQALMLMNNPFVAAEATRWAQLMIARHPVSASDRIQQMYSIAFCRQPTEVELANNLRFLDAQSMQYGIPAELQMTDERIWTDLAHVLINSKEFIFVR